jgi:hypothetical protein
MYGLIASEMYDGLIASEMYDGLIASEMYDGLIASEMYDGLIASDVPAPATTIEGGSILVPFRNRFIGNVLMESRCRLLND